MHHRSTTLCGYTPIVSLSNSCSDSQLMEKDVFSISRIWLAIAAIECSLTRAHSALPVRLLGLAVLLACGHVQPSQAQVVTTTGIIGYGTDFLADGVATSYPTFPLNDLGFVAINNVAIGGARGFVVTDGKLYNSIQEVGPAAQQPIGFTINNANTITNQLGPIFQGLPLYNQIFNFATPYVLPDDLSSASPPYPGFAFHVDTNNAGLGVALLVLEDTNGSHQNQIVRLNSDGTTTALAIDSSDVSAGNLATGIARILDNGDIYVGLRNTAANNRFEIWRFAAGETSTHSVAYSAPTVLTNAFAWGVNEGGDLVVALYNEQEESWLQIIAVDGTSRIVDGSLLVGGSLSYSSAYINRVGEISAIRSRGIGGSDSSTEVLFAPSITGTAIPVLATGQTLNGGQILSISPASDMNEAGQFTLFVVLRVGSASPGLVVRVDPPGSAPPNPILPNPCEIGRGWCFDIQPRFFVGIPLGAHDGPPTWVDPDLVAAYEYVATSNAFAGVEIPFPYGDGQFDLYLWDESIGKYVDSGFDVTAGTYFGFEQLGTTNGLRRFALYGIEAPVDPADPRGFVTGLTFVDSRIRARFSMTPVTSDNGSQNHAPLANAGPSRTVEATSADGASIQLDGSASSDPDGDTLSFAWSGAFGSASGVSPTVTLGRGTHTITLTVDDGHGATTNATTSIAVVDTTAPKVFYSGNKPSYTVDETVSIACTATDTASPIVSNTCTKISGPAYSFPLGTSSFSATAIDAAGNAGTASVTFTVTVTYRSLINLTLRLVKNRAIALALAGGLELAAIAASNGRTELKTKLVAAYIAGVRKLSPSVISASDAATLIRLASAL